MSKNSRLAPVQDKEKTAAEEPRQPTVEEAREVLLAQEQEQIKAFVGEFRALLEKYQVRLGAQAEIVEGKIIPRAVAQTSSGRVLVL